MQAKICFILLISLLGNFVLNAQYQFVRDSIPVSEGTNEFSNPWLGGLNSPQFNDIDLNNDGIEDLVIFNRGSFDAGVGYGSHKLLTFINKGLPNQVSYYYAPEYERYFPELHHWVIIRDFNCDGIEDLFTSYPQAGAIELYLGTRNGGDLSFSSAGYIEYNGFTGPVNIFASALDLPGIDDVNGDGDIDILAFNPFGGIISYYENQSVELTGTCGDTMVYELNTDCWGNIYETGLSVAVLLDSCGSGKKGPELPGVGTARDPGSTLMIFDEDGDGDNEIVLGEKSFMHLNRLVNGGNSSSAIVIDQDVTFPSYNNPYDLSIFPSAFYLDVNNDGKKDMIASPNSSKNSANWNCSWLYLDTSSTDTVVFEFVTDTFMVDECIDLGEGAFPAFFDHNSDGLLDLVVGNFGYFTRIGVYKSGLALFENVGTNTAPAYNLVDRDYMGISSLIVDGLNVQNVAPTFADMDDDGDIDLIIGDESGQLHYYMNTAGAGNTANFTLTGAKYSGIDVGSHSTPFIYDVNEDGLYDLIIGTNRGNVHYYQNRGSKSSPMFDAAPVTSIFGGIKVSVPGFLSGYSAPIITTLDDSGTKYVLVGNEIGEIQAFILDQNNLTGGSFVRQFTSYSNINEGEKLTLAVADLTGNGKLEMITGNYRGGLTYYKQIDSIFSSTALVPHAEQNLEIAIYPNPSSGLFNVYINTKNKPILGEIIIYDLSGKIVYEDIIDRSTELIDLSALFSGIYFVKVFNETYSNTTKLVIQ